ELLLGLFELRVEFVVPACPVVGLGGLLLQVEVLAVEQLVEPIHGARVHAVADDRVSIAVLRGTAPAAAAGRLRYVRRDRLRPRRNREQPEDEKANRLCLHGLPLMMTLLPLPFCTGELVPFVCWITVPSRCQCAGDQK